MFSPLVISRVYVAFSPVRRQFSRLIPTMLAFVWLLSLSGCFRLSGLDGYSGPQSRPAAMEEYFGPRQTYDSYKEDITAETPEYVLKHISITAGPHAIVVDYYARREKSENLVFVFPVLGGKNIIEGHIADYFARNGIDAAIVLRNNEFKDPNRFDELEEIFRMNVVRDRIAIDFFEQELGKKNFGTFGISRGGINVALTAGVDSRLKYNVIALGGTDLIDVFRHSDQRRIKKYIEKVRENKGISQQQFFELLSEKVKTDPKYTAQYIDARNSLLILSIFDKTVPFQYGLRLRDQMGRPPTIFLFANHYTGLLFTQTASLIPPRLGPGLFPFPYIEQEALSFYRKSFDLDSSWKIIPYRIVQFPVNMIAEALSTVSSGIEYVFSKPEPAEVDTSEQYWMAAIEHRDLAKAGANLAKLP